MSKAGQPEVVTNGTFTARRFVDDRDLDMIEYTRNADGIAYSIVRADAPFRNEAGATITHAERIAGWQAPTEVKGEPAPKAATPGKKRPKKK